MSFIKTRSGMKTKSLVKRGRSNAINIAERLGLPNVVVVNARELHGAASAEINEVIVNMEKFKQKFHEHVHEAHHHLKLARELRRNLLATERRLNEYRKMQEISDAGGTARSILDKKMRELRASRNAASKADGGPYAVTGSTSSRSTGSENNATSMATKTSSSNSTQNKTSYSNYNVKQPPSTSGKKTKVVKAGDTVHVSKLNKKAIVLSSSSWEHEVEVDASGCHNLKGISASASARMNHHCGILFGRGL